MTERGNSGRNTRLNPRPSEAGREEETVMSRSGMQPEARGYAVNAAPSVGVQLGFESEANRCVCQKKRMLEGIAFDSLIDPH